ncbi:MAG: DUF488 domain-containing protein [Bacteroidetes bacterium]|jgi:uncharacterized protein YeaO (DUF488 family)|nr:DUF488 domain-containing protein [Bacteroidota bacterium]
MLKVKRVYEKPERSDGKRILVDRLWPRGISKEKAKLHLWLKEIAPSPELREWFGHDPKKWLEFKKRYRAELRGKKELLAEIRKLAEKETVTLVYGSKEERYNDAVALKSFLKL